MRKIKCLIIDDEALAREVILKYIEELDSLEVVGELESAVQAIDFLSNEEEVDVIFLDVNMPKLSGIEFMKTLNQMPNIVITTAYREYAVESFEYDVLDYLVKPIEFVRFLKTVQKLEEKIRYIPEKPTSSKDFIFLKANKRMVKVFFHDIFYVESLKDYVMVRTKYDNLIVHHNLQSFTVLLPTDEFLRIHRSYTISLRHLRALNGNRVEIHGNLLPIGRNYQLSVKATILKNN